MSDALDVWFGGIRFRGYGDRDDFGFWIGTDGWEGWDTPPAQRAEIIARANAHGAFDSPQYFDAREVTQRGAFRARSSAGLSRMATRLAGVLDGSERKITVAMGGVTQWAKFRRGLVDPQIKLYSDGALHMAEYEIVHKMRDPRKYGAAALFSGASVQAFHHGNFPAAPVLEVAGPVAAPYTIASQGRRFTVTQALSAGQSHRIDMATGWVYRNGTLQTGVVAWAEAFTIPPGLPVTVVTGPPSMTVHVTDTFI